MDQSENEARSLAFLTGEVHALFVFAQALAKTHAEPRVLLTRLGEAELSGLISFEPQPMPDAVIDGYQFAIGGIRNAIEAAAVGT